MFPGKQYCTGLLLFLRPVWNAMCRDEVFFGDWMPDLERYL